MKTCCVCKIEKSLDEFYNYKSKTDGKSYRCKSCDNEARKRYVINNYENHLESQRRRNIKHKYGITIEEYEAIRKAQNYCCAICGLHESENKSWGPTKGAKRLSTDHCHDSNKVRGLLCNNCNRGLGFLGDTVERLEKAVEYLRSNVNRS